MDDQEQQSNPAVEDENNQGGGDQEQAADQSADQSGGDSQDAAGRDAAAQDPAVESAKTEADKDKSVRDGVVKADEAIAKGMEKVGGKPGKYIGKALTFGANRVNEGIADIDKDMGSYGNKTTTDENGNQVAQQRTTASVAADNAVDAQMRARAAVGKYTDNETLKNIAGYGAGAASVVGSSVVDAGRGLYRGTKNWLSDKWSSLKQATGMSP
ncbi:MAG TPA: hypothetical protein VKE22_25730 [Haliangiales bacterium]|nr:hypothetical protein [Haliangiales bacterium]